MVQYLKECFSLQMRFQILSDQGTVMVGRMLTFFSNLSIHETTMLPDFEEDLVDIEIYYQVSKFVLSALIVK